MAEVVVILPDPKIEISFSIADLTWLYNNPEWETVVLNITHPQTGVTKNLRINIQAETP